MIAPDQNRLAGDSVEGEVLAVDGVSVALGGRQILDRSPLRSRRESSPV